MFHLFQTNANRPMAHTAVVPKELLKLSFVFGFITVTAATMLCSVAVLIHKLGVLL
jgi:hypothetical protein